MESEEIGKLARKAMEDLIEVVEHTYHDDDFTCEAISIIRKYEEKVGEEEKYD